MFLYILFFDYNKLNYKDWVIVYYRECVPFIYRKLGIFLLLLEGTLYIYDRYIIREQREINKIYSNSPSIIENINKFNKAHWIKKIKK